MQSFFVQKITFPISKAVQIFDYIKQTGNYFVRFEVNEKNEFGKIAESINSLLDYIEKEKLKEKAIKNKLIQQAESDPLTGIKNKKAIENTNCYKIMLLTGSKKKEILNFYGNARYNSTDKTAFIQWIE